MKKLLSFSILLTLSASVPALAADDCNTFVEGKVVPSHGCEVADNPHADWDIKTLNREAFFGYRNWEKIDRRRNDSNPEGDLYGTNGHGHRGEWKIKSRVFEKYDEVMIVLHTTSGKILTAHQVSSHEGYWSTPINEDPVCHITLYGRKRALPTGGFPIGLIPLSLLPEPTLSNPFYSNSGNLYPTNMPTGNVPYFPMEALFYNPEQQETRKSTIVTMPMMGEGDDWGQISVESYPITK